MQFCYYLNYHSHRRTPSHRRRMNRCCCCCCCCWLGTRSAGIYKGRVSAGTTELFIVQITGTSCDSTYGDSTVSAVCSSSFFWNWIRIIENSGFGRPMNTRHRISYNFLDMNLSIKHCGRARSWTINGDATEKEYVNVRVDASAEM